MPYCPHCGTKLEDGQTCTCEMAQAAANQPPKPDQPPIQQTSTQAVPRAESLMSVIFKRFKLYLSSYISNPVQAVRTAMEDEYDFTLPIVMTVIRLLAMGLALYGFLHKICDSAFTAITTAAVRYGNASNLLSANLTAPILHSIFFGALIAAIMMFLFIVAIFIIVKIRHGDATFLDVFKASAINGVLPSALLLVAFLCSFASVMACLIFIALSALAGIICGVLTVYVVCPDSGSGMIWLMYFAGVALVILAGRYIMPALLLEAMGGITASYLGDTATLADFFDEAAKNINSMLKQEDVSDIWELYSKQMKEIFEEIAYEFWHSLY